MVCACVISGTLCQEQSHALYAFPDTHMGMRRYAKNYHLAFATILQGWCPLPFSAVNGRAVFAILILQRDLVSKRCREEVCVCRGVCVLGGRGGGGAAIKT